MATENKSATPASEAAPPTWLNAELIQKALHNDGKTYCQVINIAIHRATAPGDNYLSIIYRVKAELSDGTECSVLVKSLPEGEELVAYLENTKTFEKEGEMLGDVIPRMQVLLEEGSPGRWKPMTARCPLYGTNPPFVVLEDLAPQGFRMANRQRGLGLRHCLLALRSLARFHASSHALLKKDPTLNERFVSNSMDKMMDFVIIAVKEGANACREWPGFEDYAEQLEKLLDVPSQEPQEFGKLNPDDFTVIAHGDFWVNNMMFRYNENGLPCDIRMVDLQTSFVTTPALDIISFLAISTQESVFSNYEDLLIREYHFALQEALTALGIKVPSLKEVKDDLDAHGTYWLFSVFAGIPLVKVEKGADFDRVMAGDREAMRVLFTSPQVKKWVQTVLPVLKRKGYLHVAGSSGVGV